MPSQDDSDGETEDTQSGVDDGEPGPNESITTQRPTHSASAPSTPAASRNMSHGAAVAANRGLQIRTERPSRANLASPKMSGGLGLPASPRPMPKTQQQPSSASASAAAPL